MSVGKGQKNGANSVRKSLLILMKNLIIRFLMAPLWSVLLSFLLFIIAYTWLRRSRNLPPGPWNLPVIGYLAWLNPQFPYLTLTSLSKKYGPIYGLYLGSIYTVVISDAKLIKKTFNKDASSGRAPLHLTHGIMKGFGLICAQGDLWKDQRKFVHNTLRTLGASKVSPNRPTMEALILHHVSDLVQHIKSLGESVTLDPLDSLRHSLGSAINQMVFGKCWSRDDATWKWLQHLQEEGTKHIGVAGPLNFLPLLRFLPKSKQTINFLTEGIRDTHQIYREIIEEQKNSSNETVSNVIQAFLAEKEKRKNEDSVKFYNDQQFHYLLADIFGASLDTTLTTLRWYVLYMAVHQDVQKKVRSLLNDLTLEQIAMVPYFEATIAEVQRIRPVVPVGIPHGSVEELEIAQYKVPPGTMIVPLQWAVHMDANIWDEPEVFKPERFINEEGKFFKPEAFIPFQAGKRMCVGDELARMFLYLFGAALVKNFAISCMGEVDLTGDCGITLTPKPHELIFTSL
ncbi:cytochrome P450 306a1 isoform X1 [Tribolium castaneum]|uniref:cytochrome P450 306a1 isoform X1 n=1 Tax=Tribolium castaneum TaxID=7070 RepID=UPI0030FE13A9